MRSPAPPRISLLTASLAGMLTGCTPTVNVNIGAPERKLREEVVAAADAGPAKVVLIDLVGLIADAERPSLIGRGANPVDQVVKRLDRAGADPRVKAVILRINSPGGTVTGSEVLSREIERFRADTGKPLVASLGEVAASGGYYVALAADRIVAEPTSITGSIGVIIPTINASEGLSMIGVYSRSVTSGPNKDLANPLEHAREGHYAVLQGLVDEYYTRFRGRVEARRTGADPASFPELTDGRIFSGARAVQAGLADAEGGVREAFELASSLAGVDRASLVKYADASDAGPRSPYAALAAPADDALLSIRVGLPGGVDAANAYYLWAPAWAPAWNPSR
jgi:protease-4